MKIENLEQLLQEELRDLYDAEKQLVKPSQDGQSLLRNLAHFLECEAMGFREEILFAQEFEGEIERPIVQEDRAQQGAFRFEVVRNSPVADSHGRHRSIANSTRSSVVLVLDVVAASSPRQMASQSRLGTQLYHFMHFAQAACNGGIAEILCKTRKSCEEVLPPCGYSPRHGVRASPAPPSQGRAR